MQTYTCDTCGKQFDRFPSSLKRNKSDGVYCSRLCAAKRQQRELPDIACSQCGKTFYRKPSERTLNNNYCSRTCANQARSRTIQDIPSLRTSQGVETICQNCGDVFYVKPHRTGKAKYCSKACSHAARFGNSLRMSKDDISGNNNPNFRGTNNATTARENAIKFFGSRCMICGWEEVVDVHHITPRRHGGTNNLDNLIVLCPNHHRLADLSRIDENELTSITLSAIVQLSDHLPRFDPLSHDQRESAQQPLLFSEPEQTNLSG